MDEPHHEQRFRAAFERHHPDVLAYFLRRLPRDEAVEAAADVFLVAWRRIDRLPDEPEARRWLFGVAHNVLRNRHRSGRRMTRLRARTASMAADRPPDPETVVVRRAEEAELLAALDRLGFADREILRLRLWDEIGYDEIAVLLGCSRHGAEQRYAKALRRLRSAVGRTGHVRTTGATPPHPQEHPGDA
jgi:RNA polymerase sigma-70 factor (ECF subfamily)